MSEQNRYYQKINRLVSEGRLDLSLIISPPRTGSTLLETALKLSPDVDVAIHEPFISVNNAGQNSDIGYRNIYESIGGKIFETSGQSLRVIVKELSHRLSTQKEYQRLFKLSDEPVLFLIRNPLLSVESRIRKIIQTLPLKARLPTQQWMLNFYAKEASYNNWQSMDDLARRAFVGGSEVKDIYYRPDLETQGKLLDFYSTKLGFKNWNGLSRYGLESQDYRPFEEILQIDPERFILDKIGEGSLEDQIKYTETGGRAIIVDSTDFRLSPESITKELCALWCVSFDSNMLGWGSGELKLKRGRQVFNDLVWYDTLANSEGIKPLLEIPTTLSSFPAGVREHLVQGDIPQYLRIYRKQNRIGIDDTSKLQEFKINVSLEGASRLERFGVISHGSEGISSVTIQDIDPIYAFLNNPELELSREYLARKKEYSDVINILKFEGVIQFVEGDFPGRRK